jgi:sporulation protein YlmC with PRC-barrel domain
MGMQDRETSNLIGSEGTTVYGADRKEIGSVERVMIDKRSGQVQYAVLSFGGFLGIGDDYYPLPWQSLTYDESLGGSLTLRKTD